MLAVILFADPIAFAQEAPATSSPLSGATAPAPAAPVPVEAPPPTTPPTPDKPKFEMNWNNGLYFVTADKNFSFHAGAVVHYDAAFYQATPLLELAPGGTGRFADGVNLRRARFFMEGTLYHAVDYKLELEFMNGIGFSPAGTPRPTPWHCWGYTHSSRPSLMGQRERAKPRRGWRQWPRNSPRERHCFA